MYLRPDGNSSKLLNRGCFSSVVHCLAFRLSAKLYNWNNSWLLVSPTILLHIHMILLSLLTYEHMEAVEQLWKSPEHVRFACRGWGSLSNLLELRFPRRGPAWNARAVDNESTPSALKTAPPAGTTTRGHRVRWRWGQPSPPSKGLANQGCMARNVYKSDLLLRLPVLTLFVIVIWVHVLQCLRFWPSSSSSLGYTPAHKSGHITGQLVHWVIMYCDISNWRMNIIKGCV